MTPGHSKQGLFRGSLGVIAAYLYDSEGDLESIRRMAHFYIKRGQAIPYDVAMLAQLDAEWRGEELWVKVPALPSRINPARDSLWDSRPVKEGRGLVGGFWPWMRQGWAFLDAPDDAGSKLIHPALLQARGHLMRARFATVYPTGSAILANAFGLKRVSLVQEKKALSI